MNKRATWKIFFKHIVRHKRLMAIVLVCITILPIIDTVPALYYKVFFDNLATPGSSADLLWRALIAITALHIVGWFLWRVLLFVISYLQPKIMAEITVDAYAYLLKHSYEFFSDNFGGSLVRKVQRLARSFETISDKILFDVITLIIRIPTMMIILAQLNAWIAWIMFFWVVIYVIGMWAFTKWKLKYDLKKAELDSKATGILADGITNSTTIKLFSGFKHEENLFANAMEAVRRLRSFTWYLGQTLETIQVALMVALEFAMFAIAIVLWQDGGLTVGDFVLIQSLLMMLFDRVWNLGRVFRDLYEAYADADEMVTILNTPYSIQDVAKAKRLDVQRGEIQFERVRFSYRQTRKILEDFSLVVTRGEKVGLVGPSGAGKSTVTKLLLRFYDPEDGKILIDGQEISKVTQDSLRNAVSYVPQDPVLFHRSLLDNIRYANPKATDAEVIKASKLAHCHEFIQDFPEKYQTFVGERGVKLSGGERQRVAIARAILKNAPILILDEATSSLDSESEHLIQDALDKLMKNKTTIVIAHRLSTVMKMDRIIEIQMGRVTDTGTHQELLQRQGGMYRKLWEIQAGGFVE